MSTVTTIGLDIAKSVFQALSHQRVLLVYTASRMNAELSIFNRLGRRGSLVGPE